jgi:hypothetical protein
MISNTKLIIPLVGKNDVLNYFNKGKESYFFTLKFKFLQWTNGNHCREVFSSIFTKQSAYIGFAGAELNVQKLNAFFQIVEDRLNLPNNKRTKFFICDKSFIVICKVSTFWRKNSLRKQFFTMFLRCGAIYFKRDFDVALERYTLTRATKNAILFFLEGNTFPKDNTIYGGYKGIVHYLGNKSNYEIHKKLGKKSVV